MHLERLVMVCTTRHAHISCTTDSMCCAECTRVDARSRSFLSPEGRLSSARSSAPALASIFSRRRAASVGLSSATWLAVGSRASSSGSSPRRRTAAARAATAAGMPVHRTVRVGQLGAALSGATGGAYVQVDTRSYYAKGVNGVTLHAKHTRYWEIVYAFGGLGVVLGRVRLDPAQNNRWSPPKLARCEQPKSR